MACAIAKLNEPGVYGLFRHPALSYAINPGPALIHQLLSVALAVPPVPSGFVHKEHDL